MIKILYLDQVKDYTQFLDDQLIDYLDRRQTLTFESHENFDLMAVYLDESNDDENPLLIYIDKEDLFFFCEDKETYDKCSGLVTPNLSNEWTLYQFFTSLLSNDTKRLAKFEQRITDAEDEVIDNNRKDYLDRIKEFRKELIGLKRYYEELEDILDNLAANDNELFSESTVLHFIIVRDRAEHYSNKILNLRDYVTQMREACQAQIDIEQNQLMRVFTVVATIFLPLTLIAGWYGMNFKYMPELSWRYGYLLVFIVSLGIAVGLIIWFKKKRWF